MGTRQRIRRVQSEANQILLVERVEPGERPERARPLQRIGRLDQHGVESGGGLGSDPVAQIIQRERASRRIRGTQLLQKSRDILRESGGGERCIILPAIHDAPDAAALTVAPGVSEGHLVVADDAIVKIRHVERAIRAPLQIHRAEPGVRRGHEIRLLLSFRGGAVPFDEVVVEPAGHHVAEERVALEFRGPRGVLHHDGRADGRAAVRVLDGDGRVAEAVVRLAEAGVIAAAQELIEGGAVAIGAEEIAPVVPAQAKGIHLPPRVLLHSRGIHADAPRVAAIEVDGRAVLRLEDGVVAEAVGAVEPAIIAPAEGGEVAMGVFFPAEWAEEHLAFVGLAVAVGILHQPDIRDAPHDALLRDLPARPRRTKRVEAARDIQAIGKNLHLAGVAVGSEIRKHAHRIVHRRTGLFHGERVLARFSNPQAALGIPRHAHGLAQIGLRGDELDFKAGRQLKSRALVGGREWFGGPNNVGKRILGRGGTSDGKGEREQEEVGRFHLGKDL